MLKKKTPQELCQVSSEWWAIPQGRNQALFQNTWKEMGGIENYVISVEKKNDCVPFYFIIYMLHWTHI